jgi:endonuclease YncB( thermonuclease family)
VRAEIVEEDHFGRTVAECFLPDGRDLSAEMVKLGLAIDWRKYSGGRYRQFEATDVRKRLFLADSRRNGQIHVWAKFESYPAQR